MCFYIIRFSIIQLLVYFGYILMNTLDYLYPITTFYLITINK